MTISFTEFTEDPVPVYENPTEEQTEDTTLANLLLSGTLAARPAAGTAGRIYWATNVRRAYRDDGADWWPLDHGNGAINGADYGLLGNNSIDVSSNIQSLINDAIADNRAAFIPPVDYGGNGYHKVTTTVDLCANNTNDPVHIFGFGGGNRGLGQMSGSSEIVNPSNNNPIFEFDSADHTNKLTKLFLSGLSLYGDCLRVKGPAGSTQVHAEHCSFYAPNANSVQQAITMINTFWWRFLDCDITAPTNALPAMRMIGESPTEEVVIAYLVHMERVRLWNSGIWYEQNTNFSPSQSGGQMTFIDVDCEGFHGTDSGVIVVKRGGGVTDVGAVTGVTMVGVRHFDPTGTTRVPMIRCETGTKCVDITMSECLYYGAAVVGQAANVPTGIRSLNPGRDDPLCVDTSGTKINTLGSKEKTGTRTYYGSTGTPTLYGNAYRYGGDAADRGGITAEFKHEWGDGTNAVDTNLYRSAADFLKTDDSFIIGTVGTAGAPSLSWTNDQDTGLYHPAADQVGVTIGGAVKQQWAATRTIVADGYNFEFGTTNGTKIGDQTTAKLAFYGSTPVAKPGTMTQTYSTADATLSAYTADNESSAYTGIDNLQVNTPYAQVADLNALRVAYENLRAFTEDLAQFTNSLVDKLQSLGLMG